MEVLEPEESRGQGMIIQSSNLSMSSGRVYSTYTQKTGSISAERSTISVNAGNMGQYAALINSAQADTQSDGTKSGSSSTGNDDENNTAISFSDILEDEATESMTQSMLGLRSGTTSNVSMVDYKETIEKIRMKCIDYLMLIFFGKDSKQYTDYSDQNSSQDTSPITYDSSSLASTTQLYDVYTVKQTMTETYSEFELTNFNVQGTVVNADGTEIPINLSVGMSRSFSQEMQTSVTMQQVTMLDPLVINLDTNIASLADQKFEFDLDQDGILDTISRLNSGSGYLAYDVNEDGTINDGSELFGTSSGDGFADLAVYDEDHNGWIDEADSIFDKLLIWSQDSEGNDQLFHLTEKGVGAICLSNTSTDFSLNSLKNNVTNGAIRSTGVFLYENGLCGTIQHVDIATTTEYTA